MSKKKYVIIDLYERGDSTVALDWNKLPEVLIDKLPGRLLYNIPSVTSDGEVVEKTVVLLNPRRVFKKSMEVFELDEIAIGYDVL